MHSNELKELPQAMGRMTRLVLLNVSDNKLTDLPLTLGHCNGLAKFGAGINLERNPIQNQEMLRKYRIGPDHMYDFLEKRMLSKFSPFLLNKEKLTFLKWKENLNWKNTLYLSPIQLHHPNQVHNQDLNGVLREQKDLELKFQNPKLLLLLQNTK